MAGIADEVVAVAGAAGHRPRDGAMAFLRAGVSSTAPTTSSLYRDMAQGLPVEADAIIGDFVTEAQKHGIRTPLLSAAYTQLSIYAAGRAAARVGR
jgi:2-dehydropantoate 2-reductase